MRWHGRRVTVHAYTQPTDMRKGFDGLSALVTEGLQRDPLSGDIYMRKIPARLTQVLSTR